MMGVQFDRLSLLLGLSSLAMLVVLAAEVASGVHIDGVHIEDGPEVDGSGSLPNYVPQSFESFAEILQRPLFYAERKLPEEPKQQAVVAAPPEPLRLHLEGIAIMDESRIALLRSPGDNQLVQMAEGMTHNGWTLESVLADRAIFKRGDDSTEIELETDTGSRRRR
jgi:hypothetical protein